MDLTDGIQDDWQYIDGLETVTITANDETERTVRVAGVCSNEISHSQLTQSGYFGNETIGMVFSIPISNMNGMELKNGFSITEANKTEWIVNSFTESTFGSRYKATCTKAV